MNKVAQIITERILERMADAEENGTVFRWVKPFAEGAPDRAYSYENSVPYRGINRLLLENNEYLTFNKVQELNQKKDAPQYQIRKGAKGHMVCFFSTIPVLDETTGKVRNGDHALAECWILCSSNNWHHEFSCQEKINK